MDRCFWTWVEAFRLDCEGLTRRQFEQLEDAEIGERPDVFAAVVSSRYRWALINIEMALKKQMKAADLKNSELIDSILDTALRRVRSGQYFDVEECCLQYPDLAEELRVMLPALVMLEKPVLESSRSEAVSPLPSAPFQLELTDFQIVSEIGRGAMGIVYQAIQKSLGRRVALKVMFRAGSSSVNQPARFQREAEIAARLHHTNIIPVFEAGESAGHDWYAMQFIDGVNLQQLIAMQGQANDIRIANTEFNRVNHANETILQLGSTKNGEPGPPTSGSDENPPAIVEERTMSENVLRLTPVKSFKLTPQNAARIGLQIAEGLSFAHDQGILHRDIKPSNIIIDVNGRAWIADFGLAKSSDGEELTATGDVVGTVRYIAPERFRGQSDQRSDIYALGLTLIEALEGRPAFRETDRARLICEILEGSVPDFTVNVPRDLATICFKCVQRVPADRYATANDLASDLRKFLDGRAISARPLSVPTRVIRWCNRNRLIVSMLVLIVVSAGWGIVANQRHSRSLRKVTAESNASSQLADRNQLDLLRAVDDFCQLVGENRRVYRDDFRDLRDHLLKSANEISTQTATQTNVSDRVKFQLASILERLGKMSTSDDTIADSEGYLTRARDLILGLSLEMRQETAVEIELAVIHRQLASVYRRLGAGNSAQENVLESANILNRVLEQDTLTGDEIGSAQTELARTFSVKGDILFELRRLDDSEVAMMQSIQLWNEQLQEEPEDLDAAFELAVQWTRLGALLVGNLKKWREAEGPLDEAMRLYQTLHDRMQDHPDLDFWHAQTLARKAKWYYIAGEPEQAIVAQRSAIKLLEEQHLLFKRDLAVQVELGISLRQLAEFMTAQNPLEPEVLLLLDRSEHFLKVAVAGDPDDLPSVFSLEKTCLAHADVLRRLDDNAGALEKVELAIQTLEGLLKSEASVAQAMEDRYFAAVARAELLTALSRTDEALSEWDVALKYAADPFVEIVQMDRTRTIAWAGNHRQATEQAEAILDRLLPNSKRRGHVLARSVFTFAVAAQVILRENDNPETHTDSERYAKRAIELLKAYQDGGGRISNLIEGQSDLAILVDRPDFQALIGAADNPKN